MKLKELIKDWLYAQKQKSYEVRKNRIQHDADTRYNIVQRVHGKEFETYLTLDGERISTSYSNNLDIAVGELFELRAKYIAEHNK